LEIYFVSTAVASAAEYKKVCFMKRKEKYNSLRVLDCDIGKARRTVL
jgi:hypothetical protein